MTRTRSRSEKDKDKLVVGGATPGATPQQWVDHPPHGGDRGLTSSHGVVTSTTYGGERGISSAHMGERGGGTMGHGGGERGGGIMGGGERGVDYYYHPPSSHQQPPPPEHTTGQTGRCGPSTFHKPEFVLKTWYEVSCCKPILNFASSWIFGFKNFFDTYSTPPFRVGVCL